MIRLLLHALRLVRFMCGAHSDLALENLALRQQLAVYRDLLGPLATRRLRHDAPVRDDESRP